MTKKETLQVLAILKAAYPSSYNGMTREEASGTLGVWYMHFSCVPADIVMMAVQKLIGSHKFPPTVAEVKDALGSIHWEAYETLTSESVRGFLPERAKEQYRRILDATKDYKDKDGREPSVAQMLTCDQVARIGVSEHEKLA